MRGFWERTCIAGNKNPLNTWWRRLAPLMSSFRQHDKLRTQGNSERSLGLSSCATQAHTWSERRARCIFLTKVNICVPNVHSCWAGWGTVGDVNDFCHQIPTVFVLLPGISFANMSFMVCSADLIFSSMFSLNLKSHKEIEIRFLVLSYFFQTF